MYNLRKNRKGQSITEVTIIVALVLAAAIAIIPEVADHYSAGIEDVASEIEPNTQALAEALAPN